MNKVILMFLISISTIANASIFGPIPFIQPAGPGGGAFESYNAVRQAGLASRRQELENQRLEQEIAMMQEERHSMERQSMGVSQNQSSYSMAEKSKYISYVRKIIYSLENNSIGQSTYWRDSKNGISYKVTPINNVTYAGNKYCRQYRIIIKGNEGQQQQDNLACRQPNGVWLPVGNS